MVSNIKSYLGLGIYNLIRVAYYRLQIHLKYFEKKLPIGKSILGPFFSGNKIKSKLLSVKCPIEASFLIDGQIKYYAPDTLEEKGTINLDKDSKLI